MWKYISLVIAVLFILALNSCNNREKIIDQRLLPNNDFRLFQETPAWDLAKAVEDEDEEGICRILKENPQLANYQTPRYGVSLLHLAVAHNKMKSIECLLKAGANVNIRDKEYGETPLNLACYNGYSKDKSIKIIKYLIRNGAEINVAEVTDSTDMPSSPLMSACFDGFMEAVILLIDNGADVNYIMNGEYTALGESLMVNHYKIAYYLLLHNADFTFPTMHIKDYGKEGKSKTTRNVYIKEMMEKEKIHYLTPEREYYYKIVDFLKGKGIIIKESGKRNFELSTFIKEIKELRE